MRIPLILDVALVMKHAVMLAVVFIPIPTWRYAVFIGKI